MQTVFEQSPTHAEPKKQIMKLLQHTGERSLKEALDFKNLDEVALTKLFQNVQYEKIEKGEFVFVEGDKSNDKFYIIISGIVGIYKKNIEALKPLQSSQTVQRSKTREFSFKAAFNQFLGKEIRNQFSHQTYIQNQNSIIFQSASQVNNDEPQKVLSKLEEQMNKAGKKLNKLNEGHSFGELALKEPHGHRTASALCHETCEFLIILRHHFQLIQDTYNKDKILKQDFLLTNVPLLKTISSQITLESLLYSFQEQKFSKGDLVVQQGIVGNQLYFIVEGITDVFQTMNGMYVPVCQIGKGSCVGEELLSTSEQYLYNARVSTSILKTFSVNLKNIATKFNDDIIQQLDARFQMKEQYRAKTITEYIKKFEDNFQSVQSTMSQNKKQQCATTNYGAKTKIHEKSKEEEWLFTRSIEVKPIMKRRVLKFSEKNKNQTTINQIEQNKSNAKIKEFNENKKIKKLNSLMDTSKQKSYFILINQLLFQSIQQRFFIWQCY